MDKQTPGLRVAVLIDGGFFHKRYPVLYGPEHTPKKVSDNMWRMAVKHLSKDKDYLYRILYYDCPPLEKKAENPISNKPVNFGKSPVAVWRREFFEELKRLRKVAVRMGRISDNGYWKIKLNVTKELLKGKKTLESIEETDVVYDMIQKGVDIKIGIDIATLSLKRQVDQIILVSGDSDFVPAAKLARREGIDFILDPMWNNINPDLFEHIDGLQSTSPKPNFFSSPSAVSPEQK